MPAFRSPTGETIWVDPGQVQHHLALGYTPLGDSEAEGGLSQRASRGSGALGGIAAGASALASGATLGLSDVAARGLLSSDDVAYLREAREAHPWVTATGEIAGMLTPTLLSGGTSAAASVARATPAGFLARATAEGVEAQRAIGGARGLLGSLAVTGGEAAAQNAGLYLSDVALGDRDLTAEGALGALGGGFAFGSLAGGATFGIEKGTMAARRLFAHSLEDAPGAMNAWQRTSSEVLQAHDDTAAIASQRLDAIRAERAELARQRAAVTADMADARLAYANRAPDGDYAVPVETPTSKRGIPSLGSFSSLSTPPVRGAALEGARALEQTSAARIEADTLAAASTRSAPLEQQLAEMQQRINAGATLQDLNAARAAAPEAIAARGAELAKQETDLSSALGDYAERRAKVNEWVSRLKNPRTAYEAEGNAASLAEGRPMLVRGKTTHALDEDVFVEQSGGQLRTIGQGEHAIEDITPNSRIVARSNADSFGRGAVLDDAYQDAIERAKLAESAVARDAALHEAADIEQQIHRYVRDVKPENGAVIDAIEQQRAAAGRTGYHAAFARMESQAMREAEAAPWTPIKPNAEAEAAYQETLAGKGYKGPVDTGFVERAAKEGEAARLAETNTARAKQGLPPLEARPATLIDDVHEAATVLGDYEKSAAKLVETVGAEAPPAAQKATAAFREAEDAATRKQIDRTARAIGDHAERTPEQRLELAKKQQLEINAKMTKLKAEELDVKAKMPAKKAATPVATPPPAAPPVAPPSRFARFAGPAEKVAAAAEFASMAGIPGIPKPSDIPVIGPLLGAFVKMRALTGKLLGRVPATGEAKAAALAAKTKNAAARSVDRMLGLAERAMPAARGASVAIGTPPLHALSQRLFDDGQPTAPKDASPREQCADRVRELAAAASDPQTLVAQVRSQMSGVTDPDLIASVERAVLTKMAYLNSVAPKEPPPGALNPAKVLPSAVEAALFARRLEVANDPISAFDATARGTITPEAVDTLKAVYPALYAMVQQRLAERVAEIKEAVPYTQRLRMSLLYGVPLDRLLEPGTLSVLATAGATNSPAAPTQNAPPPTPSTVGHVDLAKLYDPFASRRSARG